MTNQEILENAPEGATHVDGDGDYFKYSFRSWTYYDEQYNGWFVSDSKSLRSLKDIRRIVELENKNAKMLECLCDISDACIGQLTMSYSLDAEGIGNSIYKATGMTNPELNEALKEQVKP
tara:strand:- start:558 stop:917 length:360 start_codon:yes stop_codon:yes gene_type:complete